MIYMDHLRAVHIYVYVDYRLDNDEPFYVGKGRLCRTHDFKQRNYVWHDIVAKYGVRREVVLGTYDEQFALDEEVRLIFELKTRDYFGGANRCDGGKGPPGYRHTKSAIEVLSALSRNRLRTVAGRQEASEKFTRMWRERREEIMKTHIRGVTHHKARLSETDVINVRKAYESVDLTVRGAISAFYRHWSQTLGVTGQNLFRIVHRKSWTHLP